MDQLKFGEPVEWKGKNATIVGIRQIGTGTVVDLLLVKEVRNGADLVQNVIGTARQVELVHFEHDIPAEEIERAEDWFFSLDDEQLDSLLKEKARRDHEKEQALQAAATQADEKQLLQDVKIRPSDRVLQTAEKLWKDAIRRDSHADEHEEIELPSFESKPELWKPWIDQAKSVVSMADRSAKVETISGGQAQTKGFKPPIGAVGGFFNPPPADTSPLPTAKEGDEAEQAKGADPKDDSDKGSGSIK
jgi:hypothetical protein